MQETRGYKIKQIFFQLLWWQQVLVMVGFALILILISGYLGIHLAKHGLDWGGSGRPDINSGDKIATWFVRWDSLYYLKIATAGYSPEGIERAFFPLYSILSRSLSALTSLPILWSGFFVSIASFTGAALVLYKLVLLDYSPSIALYGVMWFCISPVSFFLVAFYPQALFLLLSILSIYFARKGSFLQSGFWILLAGATAPTAALLAVPYFAEYFHRNSHPQKVKYEFLIGMLIAPLGLFAYMGYLGWQAGTLNGFNVFFTLQSSEWERAMTYPWVTLFHGIQSAVSGKNGSPVVFSRLLAIQNLGYALIGFAITIWSWFKLRRSYAFYLIGGILFLLINHGPAGNPLMSFPRHLALFFPVTIFLAVASDKIKIPIRIPLVVFSIIILVLYTAWFTSGRWVA